MQIRTGIFLISAMLSLVACSGKSTDTTALRIVRDADFVLQGVEEVEEVAQLTGPDSLNRTDRFGVAGTDLGSMFNMDDKTYFVFGDTFDYRTADMWGGGGEGWRSNVIAVSVDRNPEDGITLDHFLTHEAGYAAEIIPAQKRDRVEITRIPTHGVAVGTTMYLYFMSVNHWGPHGVWDANYSGISKSTDGGQSWTVLPDTRWDGDSNFIQVSPAKIRNRDGTTDIYFWGIPAGRFGGVQLMKVPQDEIEEIGSYRYCSGVDAQGVPLWTEDIDAATTVVDDFVGELSVIWNKYLGRWIMTYLNGSTGQMVIREGLNPWGPWGDPITVMTQISDPGIYGPYMNPKYVENGGEFVYFCLSRWGPYNVSWMKMRLVKE